MGSAQDQILQNYINWANYRQAVGRTGSPPPAHIKAKIAAVIENAEPLLRVFPSRKIRRIKKKEMSYLTVGKDGLFLVKLRLIRQPKVEKLNTANTKIEIISGLLSNTIEITSQEITKPYQLTFSKIHNNQIDSIAAALTSFGKVKTESLTESNETKEAGFARPGFA
jgi:hypothetical protein